MGMTVNSVVVCYGYDVKLGRCVGGMTAVVTACSGMRLMPSQVVKMVRKADKTSHLNL